LTQVDPIVVNISNIMETSQQIIGTHQEAKHYISWTALGITNRNLGKQRSFAAGACHATLVNSITHLVVEKFPLIYRFGITGKEEKSTFFPLTNEASVIRHLKGHLSMLLQGSLGRLNLLYVW